MGGEARCFDPGKKVRGRKRHLLADTEGLVVGAKVHWAGVFDRDGIKPLMERVGERFWWLSHLWLDAGYRRLHNGKGKGKDWVEKVLGLTAEVVRPPRRWVGVVAKGPGAALAPGLHGAAEEVGDREDLRVALAEQEDEQKDYERLPESSEAFVYVAMSRLMARRLARS